MNRWLKLALVSVFGLVVSSIALNILDTNDGMNGMSMGSPGNQAMTMGQPNMSLANINQGQGQSINYPVQWSMTIREGRPYWVGYRLNNNMPPQNMIMGPTSMPNMYMGQMQNSNYSQMPMSYTNMNQMPMSYTNMNQMPMSNISPNQTMNSNMNMGQIPMQNNSGM